MNKADLVNEVANVVSTKTEAQAAVDCILESIGKTLKNGDVVHLGRLWDFQSGQAQSAHRTQSTDRRRNPNQCLQRPQVCAEQSSQGCRELARIDYFLCECFCEKISLKSGKT
jgi:nucleoid DNA-binding protein